VGDQGEEENVVDVVDVVDVVMWWQLRLAPAAIAP
jgi:hypothetical protein